MLSAQLYLLSIGIFNFVSILPMVIFCLSPRAAEKILFEWTSIVPMPYDHGEHGAIWAFFTLNFFLFFGLINTLGAFWTDQRALNDLLLSNIVVYAFYSSVSLYLTIHPLERFGRLGPAFLVVQGGALSIWAMLVLDPVPLWLWIVLGALALAVALASVINLRRVHLW